MRRIKGPQYRGGKDYRDILNAVFLTGLSYSFCSEFKKSSAGSSQGSI